MALIKLTAFVDQITGKVRGTVFSHNKGGAYVRGKGKPTNPQTSAQMGVRSIFSAISQAWRNLTEVQRRAWDSATESFMRINRLGDQKALSGFALHQSLNQNRQIADPGTSMLSTPPAPVDVPSVVATATVDIKAGVITPSLEAVGVGSGSEKVVVFATPSMSPGISNFKNQLRQIGTFALSQISEPEFTVTSEYAGVFGTPQTGAKIGFKYIVIANTGQASAEFFESAIAQS